MAADDESSGNSKGRVGRRDQVDIDERAGQARHLDANELETIPTMVPREGDGYRLPVSGSVGQTLGRIGELGRVLTDDDLRRVNTRKGLIQLLENKAVDIEDVRKTLLTSKSCGNYKLNLSGFNGGFRAKENGLRFWSKGAMQPGRVEQSAGSPSI